MRAAIQRIGNSTASVTINGAETRSIDGPGMVILLGIEEADGNEDIEWLVGKIAKLRIFADTQHAMNLSIADVEGNALVVSQFTLHASTKKGNRPSFVGAAKPEIAKPLYLAFVAQLEKVFGKPVRTGEFGADMQVALVNDGPVTILLDSKNRE